MQFVSRKIVLLYFVDGKQVGYLATGKYILVCAV